MISARESQDTNRTSCQAQLLLLSPVAASSETESAPSSAALQCPGHGAAWLPLPAAQSLSDTRHGHFSLYTVQIITSQVLDVTLDSTFLLYNNHCLVDIPQ